MPVCINCSYSFYGNPKHTKCNHCFFNEKKKNKLSNITEDTSDCGKYENCKFNHVKTTREPVPPSILIPKKCKICDDEFNEINYDHIDKEKCYKCDSAFDNAYKNYEIKIMFSIHTDAKPINNHEYGSYYDSLILRTDITVTKTFALTKLIKQSDIDRTGGVHSNCKYLKLYTSEYKLKDNDGWRDFHKTETIACAEVIKLNQINLANDN
jgi:hypothetical protein